MPTYFSLNHIVKELKQGLRKVPSGCLKQVHVDFAFGQVTFHSQLPKGYGIRQVIWQSNH